MPTPARFIDPTEYGDTDADTYPHPKAGIVNSKSEPTYGSRSMGSGSLNGSYATGQTFELNALHFEFLLAQATAPRNPCSYCEISKRDLGTKIWSVVNLIVAFAQFCYKIWAATMVFGGSGPDIRAARFIYINFCTLNGKSVPFWTDRLGQVSYVIGSVLLFLSAFKIRKLCKNRRRYAMLYLLSIGVYLVASYVPEIIIWMFSKDCFPPGASAICRDTVVDTKLKKTVKLVALPLSLNKTDVRPNRECLIINHSYFLSIYFLITFGLVGWLFYGASVAHSFLWWLKTPSYLLNSQSKCDVRRKRLSPF